MALPGGAAKHHCAQEPTLGPKRRCADMAANPAKRRAHVRGLRAPGCAPLRRFQTATGVPLTAPTASCDIPGLPSPHPCLRPLVVCHCKWAIRLLRTTVSRCPRTVGYSAKRAAPA